MGPFWPLERFLILRCGDPVSRILLGTFPAFMWASERFHRFILREQLGDDA